MRWISPVGRRGLIRPLAHGPTKCGDEFFRGLLPLARGFNGRKHDKAGSYLVRRFLVGSECSSSSRRWSSLHCERKHVHSFTIGGQIAAIYSSSGSLGSGWRNIMDKFRTLSASLFHFSSCFLSSSWRCCSAAKYAIAARWASFGCCGVAAVAGIGADAEAVQVAPSIPWNAFQSSSVSHSMRHPVGRPLPWPNGP